MLNLQMFGIRSRIRFARLYEKYKEATMTPKDAFVANLQLASMAPTQGSIIECGTWRGGMSAALIEACGAHRHYVFFDSFEGLPDPQEVDGAAALAWRRDTQSPAYYNNCTASQDEFNATIAKAGPANVTVMNGFFDKTFPRFEPSPIAVVRLDCDWYESVSLCLHKFWDHIVHDGIVLIDDYYAWEGCAKAVHDFLSERKLPNRIYQKAGVLAYIRK